MSYCIATKATITFPRLLRNTPFQLDSDETPYYYQELAVHAATSAWPGRQQHSLTLATGTGKTFIAFQIVHKLFQARWNRTEVGTAARILFLADRNVLADQTITPSTPTTTT